MIFFTKKSISKGTIYLGGGGGGGGVGGRGTRVSQFFITKNPNRKKKYFWVGGGWGG